jgi:RNA recognition motif-containing protein
LYVGNLPDKTFFDLDLKKMFEEAGFVVKSAVVVSDPIKKTGYGAYGYVSFADEADLDKCLVVMNNVKC